MASGPKGIVYTYHLPPLLIPELTDSLSGGFFLVNPTFPPILSVSSVRSLNLERSMPTASFRDFLIPSITVSSPVWLSVCLFAC